MADVIFNGFKQYIGDGTIDFAGDDIYAAIMDTGYTPNIDSDDNWGDIKTNEVSGEGYTSGGKILGGKSVTHDDSGNLAKYDASDLTWSAVTFTDGRYLVVYKYTGVDATSKLICALDFGAGQSPAGIDFEVRFGANGLFTIS